MRVMHAAETIKGGVATVLDSLATYQQHSDQITALKLLVPQQHLSELSPGLLTQSVAFDRRSRGVMAFFHFARCFYREVRSFRPDVVHLHSTFAGLLGRIMLCLFFRQRAIRVIYCPHGFAFLIQTARLKQRLIIACERWLSRFTDRIICVGENEYQQALGAGLPARKLCLISNGVKIPEKANALSHNGLSTYTLLYVGRFDQQKGTDTLLQALQTLDSKQLDFRLHIIMVGSAINDTRRNTHITLRNITLEYTGWLSKTQIADYYRRANCLIIPSRWEGFAMVPLEAISYNLPVITSDIVAFREINQISRLFFHCGNSSSLASLLSGINHYDLDGIKSQLMAALREKYTDKHMNRKTVELYASALQGEK